MSIRDRSKWRIRRHDRMAKEVAAFLRTNAVRSVNFIFGKTHMYESSWDTVAEALVAEDPRVSVRVDRRAVRKHEAGAFYSPPEDTIVFKTFRPLWTANARGTTVHECVHAWQDHLPTTIDRYEVEGAAELAKFWYHLNVGTPTKNPKTQKMLDFVAEIRARDTSKIGSPVFITTKEKERMREYVEERWGSHFAKSHDDAANFDGWET